MTDAECAALHALSFTDSPRPWSAAEFNEYRKDPQVVFAEVSDGLGLVRIVADEAEILTLAVHPKARRRGAGRQLMAAMETAARQRGAGAVFLEVDENNAAARALYAACGYVSAGLRRNYYRAAGRQASAAVVLKKALV